jgi:hypothetical protein
MSETPTSLTQLAEEANRRLYSKSELFNYFSRIQLPQEFLNSPILSNPALAKSKDHGLPLLEALCRHHTTNIQKSLARSFRTVYLVRTKTTRRPLHGKQQFLRYCVTFHWFLSPQLWR